MKENKNYIEVLNKITTCLYVIIAFLTLNSILLIVSIGTNQDNSKETNTTEQEQLPYDVSKFKEMTTDEAMEAIKSGELQVIYIGHEDCGFCRKFVPVLQTVQDLFGYTTVYLDIDKITSADKDKIIALSSDVKENFGYTPMTILAKDGQYVASHTGYLDLEPFIDFLTTNGVKQK